MTVTDSKPCDFGVQGEEEAATSASLIAGLVGTPSDSKICYPKVGPCEGMSVPAQGRVEGGHGPSLERPPNRRGPGAFVQIGIDSELPARPTVLLEGQILLGQQQEERAQG